MPDVIGPRKARYFALLVLLVAGLFVLGVVLSQFYGFTLLKDMTEPLVNDPMVLLVPAGILSVLVLMYMALQFADQDL